MIRKIFALSLAILLSTSMAIAMSNEHGEMDHSSMNHGSMNHGTDSNHSMDQQHSGAMGTGVIHSISKLNRIVNLTHEPIPELNWPEMTMDLAVAKDVNLDAVKAGDTVKFHIMLDEDNVVRIHHIEK